MDKNTIIGLLLIFGMLMGYSFYATNKAKKAQEAKAKEIAEQQAQIQKDVEAAAEAKMDSTATDTLPSTAVTPQPEPRNLGAFGYTDATNTTDYVVNTKVAQYHFARTGGYVTRIEYTDIYRYTPKGQPKEKLVLFDNGDTKMGFDFKLPDYTVLNTSNLYFTASTDTLNVLEGDAQTLSLRVYPYQKGDSTTASAIDTSSYLEFLYTFRPDDYCFDYTIHFVNLSEYINKYRGVFDIAWTADINNVEKNYDYERDATTLYFMDNLDEVDNLNERASDTKDLTTNLKWVAFKQQFFTSILIAKESSFKKGHFEVELPKEEHRPLIKKMTADLSFEVPNLDDGTFDMSLYIGPNQYKLLEPYDMNLEKMVPLGWGFFLLHWINRAAVIPIFNWLEAYGLSYGIIILILTIIIKIVLLPIAYKTYMSSAKMRVLKPEIQELNERYPKPEDAMKKQQATMNLYKRAGVSPMAGCLPMLLQMPILIAMFRFFPSAYELRQQPFLWAEDLSTYDSILDFGFNIPFYGDHVSLFTLLMTIATLVYTWLNNKMMSAGNDQQMKSMKIMMYLMPILFLGMFNSFSSALTYYYLLVNLITFFQMWLFRVLINEGKLRQQLLTNMSKPMKKSKFQQKIEEMAKQQQQLAKQKGKK